MNLVFFDAVPWDFDAAAPFERPLGGSQSALCYLSVEMAGRGHHVTLVTGTTKPRTVRGVHCISYNTLAPEQLADAEAMIVLNGPAEVVFKLRPYVPGACKLILWTQHAADQPAMSELEKPETRAAWDRIVCVSQWHAQTMGRRYALEASQVAVMRNAIAPAFAGLFADAAALAAAKSAAPLLAYTSTPFRGLNVLISVYPTVRRLDPRMQLRVYSSMKVYGQEEAEDPFAKLYAACRAAAGVEFVGSIPQPRLAEELKAANILAYPNTFAETSCIAVMEAMAAGLFVVTSDLGALPETTQGMGILVAGMREPAELATFARAYAERLVETLQMIPRKREAFLAARWEQVKTMNTHYTWPARAAEWETFLAGLGTAARTA